MEYDAPYKEYQLELMATHDLILFVKSMIPTNWNTSACQTALYMAVRTLRMDLIWPSPQ